MNGKKLKGKVITWVKYMKHKIGDIVWTYKYIDLDRWKPHVGTVLDIVEDEYKINNYGLGSQEYITRREEQVFGSIKESQEFIDKWFYDKLCENCKYHNFNSFHSCCATCSHLTLIAPLHTNDPVKAICNLSNCSVVGTNESCCKYDHQFKGQAVYKYGEENYKKITDFQSYMEYLENCEFNPKCTFHQGSCHKTCSFEKYMNEFIDIFVAHDFNFGMAKVRKIRIKRKDWIYQTFYDDKYLYIYGFVFEVERGKRNHKIKDGQVEYVTWKDKPIKIEKPF